MHILEYKKFGKRHWCAIATGTAIVLALQVFPAMAFLSDDVPTTHRACVLDIPTDPTCTDGGKHSVYVLDIDGKSASLKHDINSCQEYMDTPQFKAKHSNLFIAVSALILVVSAFGAAIHILIRLGWLVAVFFSWLFS